MLEDLQIRSKIIAHYDEMLVRLACRIENLQHPLAGPLWNAVAEATIIRYKAEIRSTRAAMERLQEENRSGQRAAA